MANVDRPAGLIPVKHHGGGTVRSSTYRIPSSYATSIFSGDLVKTAGKGKEINVAGTSDKCVGVFAGCHYVDAQGRPQFSRHWKSSTSTKSGTEIVAYVYDDPNTMFEVQADSVANTDIGGVYDSASGTGNESTGTSGVTLNIGGGAGAKQLKVIDLAERADNDYGANAKVLVMISKHELGPALANI